MRINYGNEQIGTPIRSISVGETFFAERKSVKAQGLYMKIDGSCGLLRNKFGKNYAINLETGQPREFDCETLVTRVIAEVNFPKKEK